MEVRRYTRRHPVLPISHEMANLLHRVRNDCFTYHAGGMYALYLRRDQIPMTAAQIDECVKEGWLERRSPHVPFFRTTALADDVLKDYDRALKALKRYAKKGVSDGD